MKRKGVFRANSCELIPVDERAEEIVAEMYGKQKPALVWVHTARYPDHHRFAFAVLQKIAESIGQPVELVLTWLKRETGRFDFIRLPDGTTEKHYHSISFASMSQEDFQSWWNDAMTVIREQVLPNAPEAVYQELREMLAGKVD